MVLLYFSLVFAVDNDIMKYACAMISIFTSVFISFANTSDFFRGFGAGGFPHNKYNSVPRDTEYYQTLGAILGSYTKISFSNADPSQNDYFLFVL